jgi:hypothetical protein
MERTLAFDQERARVRGRTLLFGQELNDLMV